MRDRLGVSKKEDHSGPKLSPCGFVSQRRQFANDDEGTSHPEGYIATVKPVLLILEVTGNLEMPLAAALRAGRLPLFSFNSLTYNAMFSHL